MSVECIPLNRSQQPTLKGCVDGIISLSPPALQCRDCGVVWTDAGRSGRINLAVILSGCSGWGFLTVRCTHEKVRRCGGCNDAHRREHNEGARR